MPSKPDSKENDHLSANIEWNALKQPVSRRFDDVYFSVENGLAESEHVFVQGNHLAERFAEHTQNRCFTIIETGFGTGLNFLAAWRCFKKHAPRKAKLHFLSIEKYPLRFSDLKAALSLWPELSKFSSELLQRYPPQPWAKQQRLHFEDIDSGQSVFLTLLFDDIENALKAFSPQLQISQSLYSQSPSFGELPSYCDAWFLDGFAPSKNPDMWNEKLYKAMALNSQSGSTFATFTSAGHVRRGLSSVGFQCEKTQGFGRKREMLIGTFQKISEACFDRNGSEKHTRLKTNDIQNWLLKNNQTAPNKKIESAIVIGAGLAGSHAAYALAERGIQVRVLDKGKIANGASSNHQGVVYTRLSDSQDALSEFNQITQLFADQFYQSINAYELCGQACGVLHLAKTEAEEKRQRRFVEKFNTDARHFEYLSIDRASDLAGLKLKAPGLYIKDSGWICPPLLCRHLLNHPNISVQELQHVTSLTFEKEQWQAHTENKIYKADTCIVATAADALSFDQNKDLPVKRIRGQISHFTASTAFAPLKTVVCGAGYIAPVSPHHSEQVQSFGSSYNLESFDTNTQERDQIDNLEKLKKMITLEADAQFEFASEPAKVGFRTTTPDYFPIVGPVPILDQLIEDFKVLKNKANADVDRAGAHFPRLYTSIGYGSRGLAYAPLMSSLLADLVCGDFLSVSREMYSRVHPARFAIRKLIKNK